MAVKPSDLFQPREAWTAAVERYALMYEVHIALKLEALQDGDRQKAGDHDWAATKLRKAHRAEAVNPEEER